MRISEKTQQQNYTKLLKFSAKEGFSTSTLTLVSHAEALALLALHSAHDIIGIAVLTDDDEFAGNGGREHSTFTHKSTFRNREDVMTNAHARRIEEEEHTIALNADKTSTVQTEREDFSLVFQGGHLHFTGQVHQVIEGIFNTAVHRESDIEFRFGNHLDSRSNIYKLIINDNTTEVDGSGESEFISGKVAEYDNDHTLLINNIHSFTHSHLHFHGL